MSIQTITRTLQFKLYTNQEQENTLNGWISKCCWFYNKTLEHRIKSYRRRKMSIRYNDQQAMLTEWRGRIPALRLVPVGFSRDALRRVDRGMKSFFRRCKVGGKPGFPRFKSGERYNCLEIISPGKYIRKSSIYVPCIGKIKSRGQFDFAHGRQVGLRILRKPSGWYAQVVVEIPAPSPLPKTGGECGIDLGLTSFATLDTGEKFKNPRPLRKSKSKLKREQQRLSRCKRGSNRRHKSRLRVARIYERIGRQRRGYAHRVSRELVDRFDRIAVEDLDIKGLAAGFLAKSVHDAGWGIFIALLLVKAASAGRVVVKVDPRGTSQTCPRCGAVARKELSERTHRCKGCGFSVDRDVAAAMVIRQRAFRPVCVEEPAAAPETG